MGRQTTCNTSTMGFNEIVVLNHHDQKAQSVAQANPACVYASEWEQLNEMVANADAVVMESATPHPFIKSQMFDVTHAPAIIIDLGVPRNVDPIGMPPHTKYIDIDNLNAIIADNEHKKSPCQMLFNNMCSRKLISSLNGKNN